MKRYAIGFVSGVLFALLVQIGLGLFFGGHGVGNVVSSADQKTSVFYMTDYDRHKGVDSYWFEQRDLSGMEFRWRLMIRPRPQDSGMNLDSLELSPENIADFLSVTDAGEITINFQGVTLRTVTNAK